MPTRQTKSIFLNGFSFLIIMFIFPFSGSTQESDPYQLTLEQLGQIQFYTASRRLTSVEMTPSIVTVITDDDIKRRGYKTLHELLGDVTGFQNLTVAAWGLLSNRGLVEDNNASYLFLIDDHSMTNITFIGHYEEYRFPLLAKVKRIEIMRGPGSTLWGSDASMGVINIITKDGNSIDDGKNAFGNIKLDYDHEFAHKQDIVDLTYGKRFGEEHDLLLVSNYSNNNAPWTDGHIAGPNGLYQPNSMYFRMNQWDYEPSYDIFLKYRMNDLKIEGGVNQYGYMQPFYTPFDRSKEGTFTGSRNWLDLKYVPQINNNFRIENRLFGDDYGYAGKQWQTTDNAIILKNDQKVKTVGGESILFYKNKSWDALIGLFANYSNWNISAFNSSKGIDRNYAIFTEGTYSGIEKIDLTLGVRREQNKGRTTTDNFLPRFSAIYNLDTSWIVKYAFNTGFVRFGANFLTEPEFLGTFYRQQGIEPQKSQAHDLQFNYKSEKTLGAITLYHLKITSVPGFIGEDGPVIGQIDTFKVYYGTFGFGTFKSYGIEFEFEQKISTIFRLYGNVAYQHGRWDKRYPFGEEGNFDIVEHTDFSTYDLEPTSVPTYTWNIGIYYDLISNLLFNIHFRGHSRTHVKTHTNPAVFETLGLEYYMDVNMNYSVTDFLEFSVYVKNLFDNDDPLPHINSGYIDQYFRRQIGLNAGVSF